MKKGGPEFVKRAPEGLSLFKITPPKASSFFAPRGAMWGVGYIEEEGYMIFLPHMVEEDKNDARGGQNGQQH